MLLDYLHNLKSIGNSCFRYIKIFLVALFLWIRYLEEIPLISDNTAHLLVQGHQYKSFAVDFDRSCFQNHYILTFTYITIYKKTKPYNLQLTLMFSKNMNAIFSEILDGNYIFYESNFHIFPQKVWEWR